MARRSTSAARALLRRAEPRARATIERPSGVSSARLARSAARTSFSIATPGAGRNSVAWRLPSVMVPVLSRSRVSTSPAASTARPDMASTFFWSRRSMPAIPIALRRPPIVVGMRQTRSAMSTGDRDRRAGEDRERLQGHHRDEEDEGEAGEQNVERDLVRASSAARRSRRARSCGRGRSRPGSG